MSNSTLSARTRMIATNGILVALTVIVLFFATTLPTSRLSLYTLSSFFVSIVIIEFGIKSGWFFYVASFLLTLIVIPDKVGLIPFIIFFGIYGIVKFYIEKLNKLVLEYILKVVFFNLALALGFLLVKEFFLEGFNIKIPWWALVAVLEAVFIVYDYVYTLFIQYYKGKLRRMLGM